MAHRDLSLTGWIVNGMTSKTMLDLRAAFDKAFAINAATSYPTRLTRELYDRAKGEGYNMTGYALELPPDQIVFLPPLLYEAARLKNFDMNGFVKQKKLPPPSEARLGTRKNVRGYPGANHNRKHRDDRGCSGMCLLGLGGACVACSEDDTT